jgi:predicted enzyme related to lactoylglutathione lyase
MSTLTKHAPGTFCWPELGTSDQAGAKKFYGTIFGWTFRDFPIGPEAGEYTIFQLGGRDAAACYTILPRMKAEEIPPHWMAYISVDNADVAAKKAVSLGGTLVKEPMNVMGFGRMAVLEDPTGAPFCLWQDTGHAGIGVLDEAGALAWTELQTSDPEKAAAFYTALFPWHTQTWPGPTEYTMFMRGEVGAGGVTPTPARMKGLPPCWVTYFEVKDTDATVDKAQRNGGRLIAPVDDAPGVGRIAALADPSGARFAILQPVRRP